MSGKRRKITSASSSSSSSSSSVSSGAASAVLSPLEAVPLPSRKRSGRKNDLKVRVRLQQRQSAVGEGGSEASARRDGRGSSERERVGKGSGKASSSSTSSASAVAVEKKKSKKKKSSAKSSAETQPAKSTRAAASSSSVLGKRKASFSSSATEMSETAARLKKLEAMAGDLINFATCAICSGGMHRPAAVMPCTHLFCAGCISRWSFRMLKTSCPQCRGTVKRVRPMASMKTVVDMAVAVSPDLAATEEEKKALDKEDRITPEVVRGRRSSRSSRVNPETSGLTQEGRDAYRRLTGVRNRPRSSRTSSSGGVIDLTGSDEEAAREPGGREESDGEDDDDVDGAAPPNPEMEEGGNMMLPLLHYLISRRLEDRLGFGVGIRVYSG